MSGSIYKTPAGRELVLAFYDRWLALIDFEAESVYVETSVGETHLLVAGPVDGPPLMIVHGISGNAMQMAGMLAGLTRSHRCFFVDVPGEPNRSAETYMDRDDTSFAEWMVEVLDGLGLDRVGMMGASFGAFIILKTASYAPDRISRALLLTPGGLVGSSFGNRMKLTFYGYWMGVTGSAAAVRGMVDLLAATRTELGAHWYEHMELVSTHVHTRYAALPIFDADAFADFQAPTMVIAGAEDILFPVGPLEEKIRQVVNNLHDFVIIEGGGHIIASAAGVYQVHIAVGDFLSATAPG